MKTIFLEMYIFLEISSFIRANDLSRLEQVLQGVAVDREKVFQVVEKTFMNRKQSILLVFHQRI